MCFQQIARKLELQEEKLKAAQEQREATRSRLENVQAMVSHIVGGASVSRSLSTSSRADLRLRCSSRGVSTRAQTDPETMPKDEKWLGFSVSEMQWVVRWIRGLLLSD